MSPDGPFNLVEGQFDDTLEEIRREKDPRRVGHYVDDASQWSMPSDDDGEDIEELSGDDFEDNRVEDEDWENAERGKYHRVFSAAMCNDDIQTSRNSTTAYASTSPSARARHKASVHP